MSLLDITTHLKDFKTSYKPQGYVFNMERESVYCLITCKVRCTEYFWNFLGFCLYYKFNKQY